MKSQYNRDLNKEFFYPLKWHHYVPNPYLFFKDQTDLAEKLAKAYNIPPGSALRLISYAEKALEWALRIEQTFTIDDLYGLFQFEAEPEPIRKVRFECDKKSFNITNPYLIDRLYQTAHEAMNKVLSDLEHHKNDEFSVNSPIGAFIQQNTVFNEGPKRPSGPIIKSIGNEIFRELMDIEKLSVWKSECILVQIFSLYNVGLKINSPLMTEEQHLADQQKRKAKGITTETYLQYCRAMGKNYHY